MAERPAGHQQANQAGSQEASKSTRDTLELASFEDEGGKPRMHAHADGNNNHKRRNSLSFC